MGPGFCRPGVPPMVPGMGLRPPPFGLGAGIPPMMPPPALAGAMALPTLAMMGPVPPMRPPFQLPPPPVLDGVPPAPPSFCYFGEPGHQFTFKPCNQGDGLFRKVGYPYNEYGHNQFGYDWNGYQTQGPAAGFDPWGYDTYGFDAQGVDPWGFDRRGYDRNGLGVYKLKHLLPLRSSYIEDPFAFRYQYHVDVTGNIQDHKTGRQIWPTSGEYHPYRREAPRGPVASAGTWVVQIQL
jgi:hypothetical protein